MLKQAVCVLLVVGCWVTTSWGKSSKWPIDVVVDLTEAGKKVALPTAENPTYYYPVVGGYKEMGALVGGEKPPQKLDVIHQLAEALAKQHYFVASAKSPKPSVLLVFHWGYMNPMIDDMDGTGNPASKVFFNQKEMLALVAGGTMRNLDLSFEREDVMTAATEDRYFVVVTAYDFEAAMKKQKTVLWSAKISAPSQGVTMSEIIPTLIATGAPQFGKETKRPQWISAPLNNKAKVELGPTQVKEYVEPAPTSESKSTATPSPTPAAAPTTTTPSAENPPKP